MVKNHLIKFYVDEEQYNRIQSSASAKGFVSVSSYLRDLALNRDIGFYTMLVEIHREVVKVEKENEKPIS